MAREGFHPDYHDHRFEDGLPYDEDEDGYDPEPPEPKPRLLDRLRLRSLVEGGRNRMFAVLSLAVPVAVGFVMLAPPTSQDADPFRPAPPTVRPRPPETVRPMPPAVPRPDGNPAAVAASGSREAPTPPAAAPYAGSPLAPTLAPSATPRDARDPFTGEFPSPVGTVISGLARDAAPDRVIDLIGRRLRLPTREVSVTSDAWKEPRTLSLPFLTVSADGKVVESMPRSRALQWTVAGVAAALLLGALLGAGATHVQEKGSPPYEGYESGFGRLTAGLAMIPGLYLVSGVCPDLVFGLLLVACVATVAASRMTRIKAVVAALSLGAAGLALGVPVVPPHASLAGEYGTLGIHAWDVAACAAGSVAGLLWLLHARSGRTVHVHAPSHPLVQNVRVVEDLRER